MGFKKSIKTLIILFIIICNNQNITLANIIYDKDNVIITELELEEFKKLYFQNKKIELNKLKAIKELVLLKKTINQLELKQPNALKTLDSFIINEFGENKFNNPLIRDFLRYFKIRNEFIIQYFNDELKIDDIRYSLNSFSELNMPLSNNGCKTVNYFIDLKDNSKFIETLFENFKKNQRNFEIEIENQKFDICINEKNFSLIESKLINYIETKTENRFKEFIYEK